MFLILIGHFLKDIKKVVLKSYFIVKGESSLFHEFGKQYFSYGKL